ncbi:ricin-type beta-trefoil lectin domain protein [Kitasatospora sp. NPDC008050]|uniref:ricin-type beta-trefoil lectin domain protein n=1 Tax=Kitasatospora sp. NPDC008050 TaxID=3364021 RepID=UPI0036E295AB
MTERSSAPRHQLGVTRRRLAAIAVLGTALAGTTSPALASPRAAAPAAKPAAKPAATTPGVPGSLTGHGTPDLAAATGGDLIVFPMTAQPFTASTAAQSPEGVPWTQYQVSHRGSLTGGSTDDLYVLSPGSHTLYAYPNDAEFGGTPGQFSHKDKVTTVAKPACAAPTDCTGYDPSWHSTTQILATNGIDNGDGLPDLITVENGQLWYYPGAAGTLLGSPVRLGTGDWSRTRLVAPGKVAGTPTLWAESNTSTGTIASYPLAFNADRTPAAALAAPTATQLQPAATLPDGSHPCLGAQTVTSQSRTGVAVSTCANNAPEQQWVFGTDGSVHDDGKCLDSAAATAVPGGQATLETCDGRATEQHWQQGANGSLTDTASGRCLAVPATGLASPTAAVLAACDGTPGQSWGAPGAAAGRPTTRQTLLPLVFGGPTGDSQLALTSLGDASGAPDLVVIAAIGLKEYQGRPAAGGTAQFTSTAVPLGAALSSTGTGLPVSLAPGQRISGIDLSADQAFYGPCGELAMQEDGNLVLRRLGDGQTLWSTGTNGHLGAYAVLNVDGGFYVVEPDNNYRIGWTGNPQAPWTVDYNTFYQHPYFATFGSDCNFVIHDPSGNPVWSTRTYQPAGDTTGHPLMPGTVLHPGDSVAVDSATLTMQPDGNLVLVPASGRVLWTSATAGHPGATATMQPDGNLVVYDPSGNALWASGSNGHPGSHAILQNDGNLVVYDADSKVLWASGSSSYGVDTLGPWIAVGTTLHAGGFLSAANGELDMQGDGNLVLYSVTHRALWSTVTWGHPGATATMQPDGNLVVYDASHNALWASGTNGHNSAHAVLQADNNFVVYDNQNNALWSSGTNRDAPTWRGIVLRAPASMNIWGQHDLAGGSRLAMQPDGNLVLYSSTNHPLWAAGTNGHPGAHLQVQYDGNVVVYDTDNKALWSTHTDGNLQAYLVLQDDGNLVVYDWDGLPLWSSGTNGEH